MNYVNGFLFNKDRSMVALIRKEKPEWQKDRLNGIGGKIEDGETPLFAMQREFEEETGAVVEDWHHFAALFHSGHIIHFFVSFEQDTVKLNSTTDEKVGWYLVSNLNSQPIIGNLKWLIPLALDPDKVTANIEDSSKPWSKEHEKVQVA